MPTWVPEDQQTPAWKVMEMLWTVRIPHIQLRSTDHLKAFGMPTVGDPYMDSQTANELITTCISINRMVEYFKQGANIRVVNPQDTKKIYEIISQLLSEWNQKMTYQLNPDPEVAEYLVDLDKLAGAVYEHAQPLLDRRVMESALAGLFGGQGRGRVMQRSLDVQEEPVEPDAPPPRRQGMADMFNQRRAELGTTGGTMVPRWK